MQYCSLQHRTLLLSPVASQTGFCFCFGSISLFFLELFLHWSPVAHLEPTNLGHSSSSVLSFCLCILLMGSQGKNTQVVCHSLLLWIMFCQKSPLWLIHLGWPYMAWFIVYKYKYIFYKYSIYIFFGYAGSLLWHTGSVVATCSLSSCVAQA